ncbi:MAG: elongation factor P hydroxylase [Pseudomonadota bacterium]
MPKPPCPHPVEDPLALAIIDCFQRCFGRSENTRLIGGADEPLYLPAADGRGEHRLYFNRDYPASALHEIAHWCIAGLQRRQQTDYGYWYAPDGRNTEQQRQFEKVEIKPQAIERLFSEAVGLDFHPSIDNLDGHASDALAFEQNIARQYRDYCRQPDSLPPRARQFLRSLRRQCRTRAA